jgi:hypothetical protein
MVLPSPNVNKPFGQLMQDREFLVLVNEPVGHLSGC